MTTAARSKQHQRDADPGAQPDHEAGRSRRRVRADRGQERREGRDSPGGLLAVMDVFAEPSRRTTAFANFLGLFVFLSFGSQVNAPARLYGWLREAGFGATRRIRILRIPGQAMYVVSKTMA